MALSDLKRLVIPAVHLNGTSKEQLIEQLCDAATSIRTSMEALSRASPHARDYYVKSPEAYKIALEQHDDRMRKLREIFTELEYIALEIS